MALPKLYQRREKRYQRLLNLKKSPYTYRTLISEKTFLKVQRRARGLGVQLHAIDYDGFELRFLVQSGTYPDRKYTVIIQLNSLEPTDIIGGNNVAEVLRSAKLKCYCTCPAWLFWGYAYKAWARGYGIYPERRYPHIRNPHLKGYLCKHTYAALTTFPFIVGSIGQKLKKYWTEQQAHQIEEQLEKALKKVDVRTLPDV